MKKLLKYRFFSKILSPMIFSFVFSCSFSVQAQIPDSLQTDTASAQLDIAGINTPLWKFWIAFEDATGAKDSIWLIFDPSASFDSNTDTVFGEVSNPYDSTVFGIRYCGDSPFNDTLLGNNIFNVSANGHYSTATFLYEDYLCSRNYVLPITLSWDSTMLTESYSPGGLQYATLYNEYIHFVYPSPGFDQEFDMTSRSSIVLPEFSWGSQCHFPLYFRIMSTTVGIDVFSLSPFRIFPNPTTTSTSIQFEKEPNHYVIEIFSLEGLLIQKYNPTESPVQIDLSKFQKGIYLIVIQSKTTNKQYHEKIIKF